MTMAMNEGHAVNGVWLNTLGCETTVPLTAPDYAGEDIAIPYDSQTLSGTNTPRGNDYVLDIVIAGQTASESPTSDARKIYHQRVQDLGKLIINDSEPYTLTRRLTLVSGDQDVTTWVKYVDGFDIDALAPPVGRAVVRLKKLWPHFYASAVSAIAPLTLTPGGSAATNRMLITMSGAVGQVLTNTTTGEAITIIDGSGQIVIDTMERTVTRGVANHIGSVAFTGPQRAWFRLKPGANVITLSSGSCGINYYSAYL